MTSTIHFPEFLAKLDYDDRSNRRSRSVEAWPTIEFYCRNMTKGMAYQTYIYSESNLKRPDVLGEADLKNARQINSLGWSYAGLNSLQDRKWAELTLIPFEADLLDTKHFDEAVIEVLVQLCEFPGVKIANATKFLHQKRPSLVPILDAYARQALN